MPVMFHELRASTRRGRNRGKGRARRRKEEKRERQGGEREGDYERRGKIQPVKLRKGYLTGNSDSHWVKGSVQHLSASPASLKQLWYPSASPASLR